MWVATWTEKGVATWTEKGVATWTEKGLLTCIFFFATLSMKPLVLVCYPTSSELLVNWLLDPCAPTSPDPYTLHDCNMRSSWLRSNFKSFVNYYKQDPQRFKGILLEMNYMCLVTQTLHKEWLNNACLNNDWLNNV